jgi:hypothetical protein
VIIKSLNKLVLALETGIELQLMKNNSGIWENFDIDSYVFRDIRRFIASGLINAVYEHDMKVSDVVVPVSSKFQLSSGSSTYTHAIVVSEIPFVLASDDGNMRWESTIKPNYFKVVGTAHKSTMGRCLHRVTA